MPTVQMMSQALQPANVHIALVRACTHSCTQAIRIVAQPPHMRQSRSVRLQVVQALHTYNGHSGVVEDVAWHSLHPDIFASVGDDKKLMIWDLRERNPRSTTEAHTAEVNCVQARPALCLLCRGAVLDNCLAAVDLEPA